MSSPCPCRRSLGTRVLRYGRDSCQETLELISSILRVNWRRDLFGLGQDGAPLGLPSPHCAEVERNLPPVTPEEYDEASSEWLGPSGLLCKEGWQGISTPHVR